MAKEKKLTIKHLYGKDLDKISPGGKKLFPVYVIVTFDRKNTKFKSPSLAVIHQLFELDPELYPFDFSLLADYLKNHIQNVISEDLRIIKTLKEVFKKFKGEEEEFDVIFYGNHRAQALLTPIDFHAYSILRSLLSAFCSKVYLDETKKLIDGMNQRDIFNLVFSLQELNPALFQEILKNEELQFFINLIKNLQFQRAEERKFFYLIDIYDSFLLDSLSDALKSTYSGKTKKEIKELIFKVLDSKIIQIIAS